MTEIELANQLLRSLTTTSIRIVDRGGRLSLRLYSCGKQKWIGLNLQSDRFGVKKALLKAFEIDSQIDNGELILKKVIPEKTLSEWIVAFENYYFSVNARTPQSEGTWKGEYLKSFKKIEGNRLTGNALRQAILSTNPDTRTRKRVVQACQRLSDFAEKDWDFSEYKGKYSYKSVNPRLLPSDDEILVWGDRIPCPKWRWFYLTIVAYGCRPSETFFCYPLDSDRLTLQIESTKTGEIRESFPLYPDWPNRFDLLNFKKPDITFRKPSEISERAGKYFSSSIAIPFDRTTLRHCWARRACELGLDPDWAAKSLGHDPEVHRKIYKRWIGRQVYQQKFDDLVEKLKK